MKNILSLMLFLAVSVSAFGQFKTHRGDYETHFTWDCYGEVTTIDEVVNKVMKETNFLDSLPGTKFLPTDTIVDGKRTHYYYHAFTPEGYEMVYQVFEIHTIKTSNGEAPYFANGCIRKDKKTTADNSSTPVTMNLKGTMKQCEVNTLYSGRQTIDYLETDDGTGYLVDKKRNIFTLDASDEACKKADILYKQDLSEKDYSDIINKLSPYKTNGDLFKTGYEGLSIFVDSLTVLYYQVFTYKDDEQVDDYDRNVSVFLKDHTTDTTYNLFFGKMHYDSQMGTDTTFTVKFSKPLEIKNANWMLYAISSDENATDTIMCSIPFCQSINQQTGKTCQYTADDFWRTTELEATLYNSLGQTIPALDAHFGMQKIYDAYHDVLDAGQYIDDKDVFILANGVHGRIVALDPDAGLCLYSGKNKSVFGIGFGNLDKFAEIPVMPKCTFSTFGHEFTHNIQHSFPQGALLPVNESGALNESFADIIGTSLAWIAIHGKDSNPDWQFQPNTVVKYDVNDNSMTDIFDTRDKAVNYRDFKNPELSGALPLPNYYKGEHWMDCYDRTDQGGVHVNCGVHDHWFYLMAEGGEKTIPFLDALNLSYQTLRFYSCPLTDYEDVYELYKATAKYQELFGTTFGSTDDNALYQASIANWHKVGVGLNYDVDPTAIHSINAVVNAAATKCIENGLLVIKKNGLKYTPVGGRLR